uniref:Uncharacterized protein n=1 Tax=Haptolina ericina TaxID=156174 RepID=A0A7S3F1E2_9EUKA
MAYAVGALPSSVLRITRLEMTWQVGAAPARSYAFFSPWFGMDPLDNLNLIQPVNPWGGRSWSMYTEYYQWRPSHNSNSIQKPVLSGQTLKGSLVYDASSDSYELSQTVLETGVTSSQVVPCQNGKKFLVPYIVYEKVFPCRSYPPDGVVTFRNITMECETASAASVDCKNLVTWSAQYKDDNCNMRAHVDSSDQIRITWDTSAISKYDNHTAAELVDLNSKAGWAQKLIATRGVAVVEA